ncbi:beta-lactamase family protein [Leptospira wolffii serovar Khorat str. Khorat-H2]|nr:beta-lactamase family protein [Leptospira wolffii serovar Khorat str. Khorat-H2]
MALPVRKSVRILAMIVFFYSSFLSCEFSGVREERMRLSPNYKDGAFRNRDGSKTMAEEGSLVGIVYDYLISRQFVKEPKGPIPTIQTNLKDLPIGEDLFVWFGHSSLLIQLNGIRFLVDPVFSGYASPVWFSNRSFPGTDVFSESDFPEIDYLIITHDHYDHLDLNTISKFREKVREVIVPLGLGEYFEDLGYKQESILEKDWFEQIQARNGDRITLVPAKHSSGRSLIQNRTLWTSYIIQSKSVRIFISGDGGYGEHFADIGRKYGPFTIAFLENGQYRKIWRNVHSFPEEVIQTGKDLNAEYLVPVHSCKFTMALHDWDEPLKLVTRFGEERNVNVIAPMIGESVSLVKPSTKYPKWWERVK